MQGKEKQERLVTTSSSGLGTGWWSGSTGSEAQLASQSPLILGGFGPGGLVKQRSLTCWQSEPQRLVKRRCHGPCSPSAEEGCPCRLLIGLRSNGSHLPRLNVRDGNRPLSTLLGSQAGVERTDQSLQWSRPARNLKTTCVSEIIH